MVDTTDRYQIIHDIQLITSSGGIVPRDVIKRLKLQSIESTFLESFDSIELQHLLAILLHLTNLNDQLDVIATIANVLRKNDNLRYTTDKDLLDSLKLSIPHLFIFLNYISERQINSESQYKNFLPVFRLYFLMAHNNLLLPNLRSSVLKISGKLLNFVALSSSESSNLNIIIIEILNIIYVYIHQVKDMEGLDSSFVLSCNKFQMLYYKAKPSKEYDDILTCFGNVLLDISTSISQHYSLNKLKFATNEVTYINRFIRSTPLTEFSSTPSSNLLTLCVLITIDYDDTGVKRYIKDNLDLETLSSLQSSCLNLPDSLNVLKTKLREESSSPLTPPLSIPQLISPTLTSENESNPLESVIKTASNLKNHHTVNVKKSKRESLPRFEDLDPEEQDKEIEKMKDLLEKIEKNGLLKMKMK